MYAGKYLSLTQAECARRVFAGFSYTAALADGERDRLIAEGIAIGEEQAARVRARHPGLSPIEIAAACGVKIRRETGSPDKSYVQFATYHAKPKEIAINNAAVHLLGEIMDEDVTGIVVAHELFHHYEMTEIGRVGIRFHMRRLLFGLFPIKQSLLPVGEVAANAFCRKLTGIGFEPMALEGEYFDRIRARNKA